MPGIDHDLIFRRAGAERFPDGIGKEMFHVVENVERAVGLSRLCMMMTAARGLGNCRCHAGVAREPPDVVHDMRARLERSARDLGFRGVDRDRGRWYL